QNKQKRKDASILPLVNYKWCCLFWYQLIFVQRIPFFERTQHGFEHGWLSVKRLVDDVHQFVEVSCTSWDRLNKDEQHPIHNCGCLLLDSLDERHHPIYGVPFQSDQPLYEADHI